MDSNSLFWEQIQMMNVWHGLRLFQTAGIIAQLWESLRRFLSFISVWLLSCIFFVSCNIKFVNLCFFFENLILVKMLCTCPWKTMLIMSCIKALWIVIRAYIIFNKSEVLYSLMTGSYVSELSWRHAFQENTVYNSSCNFV